jgi:protein-S-isoprenylcysteine O-methyltransferase Ste14
MSDPEVTGSSFAATAEPAANSLDHARKRSLRRLRMKLVRLSFIPIVFVAIFGWRSWSDNSITELVIESVGYLFLVSGVAMRLWATLFIGGKKSIELTVDGPYSLCRNPLYVGTVLLAIGASLCLENLLLLAMTLLILVPVHAFAIIQEERLLAATFGQQFETYRSRVPRFFPSFKHFHNPQTISVSTEVLLNCVVNVSVIVLIPLFEDLIEVLHSHNVLPVLWRVL